MVVLAGLVSQRRHRHGRRGPSWFRELLGSSYPTTVSVLRELSVIVLNRAHVSREFDEVDRSSARPRAVKTSSER